jgi:peptidoglycan hydrolase CwlO-like protein
MKRIASAVAVATLAISLIVVSLVPALANHNPAHTQRQINQLQNQITSLKRQVNTLKGDVRGINNEVFNCEFLDTAHPATFPDGTVGFPIFEDQACTNF